DRKAPKLESRSMPATVCSAHRHGPVGFPAIWENAPAMDASRTTAAVQRYLDELRAGPGDSDAPEVVRELLERSAFRLQLLCTSMLRRSYARLTRPPLNLSADEMLGSVAERLIKALKKTQPATVRDFFGLANQHIRWELNELARHLDDQTSQVEIDEQSLAA